MRGLMFSTIAVLGLLGSGVLMASNTASGQEKSTDLLSGGVAKFYNSNTLLLDNHHHMIRLSDTPAPPRDFAQEAARIKQLTKLVGSGKIACNKVAVDRYGMDVAECTNHRGESLNKAMIAY